MVISDTFDNDIDMTVMKTSDDTKVENISPRVGRFISPDDPGVSVLASGRLPTSNIIAFVGKFGYCDNEIDMVGLENLTGPKVINIEPLVSVSSFLMVLV